MRAPLPLEYHRSFRLFFYWVSHGLLLLRSAKTKEDPRRIDILFGDVRWMTLPGSFKGIRIERGELSDIPLPLTAHVKEEAHFMSVYKVISQGVTHHVLASEGVSVSEDQGNFFENSPLLPIYDFPALVAPLWKD